MKVLITGTPGSGKTAVAETLQGMGCTSFDGEKVPELVRLEIKATGEPAEWPTGFVDWNYYAWNIKREPLEALLAKDENVFVGLSGTNLTTFFPLFDKIIALSVKDEILGERLRARKTHEFGQIEADVQRTMAINFERTASYVAEGAVVIENTGTIEMTANAILAMCRDT